MAHETFENLKVYRVAEALSDEIWKVVLTWDNFTRDTVGTQLVRSADSIGANIAEGAGRRSFQDNRRFIRRARGSYNETKHWMRRAFYRKLLSTEQVAILKPLLDSLSPALNTYMKSIAPAPRGHSSETEEPQAPNT
jgi:four helix bundle protein